ncbi:MAG: AarF/ABC1/UbiB kinase family protein [Balneolaceae bacterium]|nr:MAG: AarF/ABC1/UbiB kinase family protein [Balneolaceae bacterium]
MSDFPSTRFERGKIYAKSGLKAGKNIAGHYLKSLTGRNGSNSELFTKTAEDLLGDFTKLRGTALKIAQSFSIDQGFLPEEFTEVMSRAQYSVPPINRSLVRSIIRRELGRYPEQIFAKFGEEAIAAASIGQVHRAQLHDGREVAVKIQYPGVRDTISSDLALARTLLRQIVSGKTDLDKYLNEIRETLLRETDYIQEGNSIRRFHQRFQSDGVVTPQWIEEYSTQKVLTMTYLKGVHLDEFLKSDPDQSDKDHYGQLFWDFFHNQIRDRDEVHADTHPGNFLFTEEGRLGVIDFGCVKRFPAEFFNDYLQLLPTHLSQDDDAIQKLYLKLDVLKCEPSSDKTEQKIFEFCKNYGFTFAMPYLEERFNFGDPEYKELLAVYTKNAPFTNEPRGNENFLYTTRVHLGLYHFLMKLGATVDTSRSKSILENVIHHAVPT